VAALAARDPAIPAEQRALAAHSARRHLALAADPFPGAAAKPALVLVSGVVGTGKSTVAQELAARLDAVVIASDRVRKQLLGVSSSTRLGAGWQQGAYTTEQTARTYTGVLERARPVLGSGRTAILDAAFPRRAQRESAARLACELGADALLVEVCCNEAAARERLARRAEAGTDPSDAGPQHYAASASGFEAVTDWPQARRTRIHTDREGWRNELPDLAAWVRTASQ
jgi:hypothetical protein